jgi:ribose 5-phosphate isomerase B
LKISIGCDHAAFEEKELLISFLKEKGIEVLDCGPFKNERCNYPDFAAAVARDVQKGGRGVLLCGSGIGVSIVANRFSGVRAALCRSVEEAELSRKHNDSNIICFGARVSSMNDIKAMVQAWLECSFEEGRHSERIAIFNDWGEKS